jgi:hypothetical protein
MIVSGEVEHMPPKWIPPEGHDIFDRYAAGEAARSIARDYDVDTATIQATLRRAGIDVRSFSDARIATLAAHPEMAARLSDSARQRAMALTPEERSARSAKAWETLSPEVRSERLARIHAGRTGRRASDAERQRYAIAMAGSNAHIGRGEREFAVWLREAGLDPIPQQPINRYNIDLFVEPVCIEIMTGIAVPWRDKRFPRKVEHLLDAGFNVLAIWSSATCPLVKAVTEEAVSFIQASQRDPSFRGQYRVVRGAGELLAAGSGDFHKLASVRAPHHRPHLCEHAN